MEKQQSHNLKARTAAFAAAFWASQTFFSPCLSLADGSVVGGVGASPGLQSASIVENTSEDWTWTGMQTVSGDRYHGGSVNAGGIDTCAVYVFNGTGVKVFGIHSGTITVDGRSHALGKMSVLIDGKQQAVMDLSIPPANLDSLIFQVSGLSQANHVLELKVIEGWGVVDYIEVDQAVVDDGGKDYRISPKNAPDEWLDLGTDTMEDDTPVIIFGQPRPNHSQIWHIVAVGNGAFRISPKEKAEEVITVTTHVIYSPTRDASHTCGLFKYTGALEQKWEIVPGKPGYFKISNALDHKCLNVFAQRKDDGAPIIAWPWNNNGGDNDQWCFVPVH